MRNKPNKPSATLTGLRFKARLTPGGKKTKEFELVFLSFETSENVSVRSKCSACAGSFQQFQLHPTAKIHTCWTIWRLKLFILLSMQPCDELMTSLCCWERLQQQSDPECRISGGQVCEWMDGCMDEWMDGWNTLSQDSHHATGRLQSGTRLRPCRAQGIFYVILQLFFKLPCILWLLGCNRGWLTMVIWTPSDGGLPLSLLSQSCAATHSVCPSRWTESDLHKGSAGLTITALQKFRPGARGTWGAEWVCISRCCCLMTSILVKVIHH